MQHSSLISIYLKLSRIIGWPVCEGGIMYRLYTFIIAANQLFFFYLDIRILFFNSEPLENPTITFSTFCMVPLLLGRHFYMWLRREKFKTLVRYLENNRFYVDNKEFRMLSSKYVKRYYKFLRYLIGIAMFGSGLFSIAPLLNLSEYYLPYANDLDINYKEHRDIYAMMHVASLFYSWSIGLGVVSNDVLVPTLLLQEEIKLRVFNQKVVKIFSDPKLRTKNYYFLRKTIKDFVDEHNRLISTSNQINELFGITMGFQFVITTLAFCLAAIYSIQTISRDKPAALALSCFFLHNLIQLIVLSTSGQRVLDQSVEAATSIYKSKWQSFSKDRVVIDFVLLMMRRSQRPLVIRAGAIYDLNHASCMLIFNASYSILTLLLKVS